MNEEPLLGLEVADGSDPTEAVLILITVRHVGSSGLTAQSPSLSCCRVATRWS